MRAPGHNPKILIDDKHVTSLCEVRDWAKTVTKHIAGFHHHSSLILLLLFPLLRVFLLPTGGWMHMVHQMQARI